jgi:probable addiction module antidote protein
VDAGRTRRFDPAAYLDSDTAIAEYMSEALAAGDGAVVADALDAVARVRGIGQLTRALGRRGRIPPDDAAAS